MKVTIIGLMQICDEGDVLAEVLEHLAPLVDVIVAVDAGSEDCSPRILNSAAQRHPNILVLAPISPAPPEHVRPQMWKQAKSAVDSTTWFMFADADEFVASDFRDVVIRATQTDADLIFSEHVNFYFTRREAENWNRGLETIKDRARPISERRRYYAMNVSQPRFLRYRSWVKWNNETFVPQALCIAHSERVQFRHYQYRDPIQIQQRLKVRSQWTPLKKLMDANPHWRATQLEEKIADGDYLDFWDGKSHFKPYRTLPPMPKSSSIKRLLKRARAYVQAAAQTESEPELFRSDDLAVRLKNLLHQR